MSNTTTTPSAQPKLEVARKIDDIAAKAVEIFNGTDVDFEKELEVAQAMNDMRGLLTPQIMAPVMALMNTPIGFLTDRDPKNKDRDGRNLTPYEVDIVRDCVIEAKLRGYHTVGNEFNIIAGRFYAAKAGIRRKVISMTTDFKDFYEVPRLVGDKGAIVKCRASWKKNGTADSVEREIPVKVNSFMGSDAILGKAERKLLKTVLDRLLGVSTPDGEVGEDDMPPMKDAVATPQPGFTAPTSATAPKAKRVASKKDLLGAWMTEKQYTWPQVQNVLKQFGEDIVTDADSIASFDDLNEDQSTAIFGARTGIENVIAGGVK